MGRRVNGEARLKKVTLRLLDCLEASAAELDACILSCREKKKTPEGELVEEYIRRDPDRSSPVDRAGLKQLTGVVKDLQDIFLRCPEREEQEEILRLRKLETELAELAAGGDVTLRLEGEAEEYAV